MNLLQCVAAKLLLDSCIILLLQRLGHLDGNLVTSRPHRSRLETDRSVRTLAQLRQLSYTDALRQFTTQVSNLL